MNTKGVEDNTEKYKSIISAFGLCHEWQLHYCMSYYVQYSTLYVMGHRKHGSMYKGKYPIGAIKLMEIMIQYHIVNGSVENYGSEKGVSKMMEQYSLIWK